jgi:putative endonuclease
MAFYVYVLRSQSTGKTYVGQTADLERRVRQHNDPLCKLTVYTKRNPGPWLLIHHEVFETRAQAMERERVLKSGQGRRWIQNHLLRNQIGC